MKHCRLDYEAIQPFPTKRPHWVNIDGERVEAGDEHLGKHMDPIIPDDEPVFILRAKDVNGPRAVRDWAARTWIEGNDQVLYDRVGRFADEMEAYAAEHYGGGKIADTPHDLLRPVTE